MQIRNAIDAGNSFFLVLFFTLLADVPVIDMDNAISSGENDGVMIYFDQILTENNGVRHDHSL